MQSEMLSNKSNLSTVATHCIKLQNTKEFLIFPDNYLVIKWQWLLLHIPPPIYYNGISTNYLVKHHNFSILIFNFILVKLFYITLKLHIKCVNIHNVFNRIVRIQNMLCTFLTMVVTSRLDNRKIRQNYITIYYRKHLLIYCSCDVDIKSCAHDAFMEEPSSGTHKAKIFKSQTNFRIFGSK